MKVKGFMKVKGVLYLSNLILALLCAPALSTPKPATEDLIEARSEKKVKGFDSVRFADNVDLRRYTSFLVKQPQLEFDKHWLREHKSAMTENDEARIRESYTRVLKEAIESNLSQEAGWQKVEQAGPNTLVIAPSLTRFRINAPDLSFRAHSRDFVEHTGAARLTLTLLDGSSNGQLVELSDYSQTRSAHGMGDLQPTNRVENLHDFKMLSKRWAKRFGEYLGDRGKN
jgi:hypothetical protein